MAKPTTKKSKYISVYNDTTRTLGCYVSAGPLKPPRQVKFLAGNNDAVLREDWELCMKNEKFAVHTHPTQVKERSGRTSSVTALQVGVSNENQVELEAELDKQLEEERKKLGAEG